MQRGPSQGNPYPEQSSRHSSRFSQKHPVNCGYAENSWACRDREITAPEVCYTPHRGQVSDAARGPRRSASHTAAPGNRVRGAGTQRVVFADGEITLQYACSRSARAEARHARREWIVRVSEKADEANEAPLPMWTSRKGWLTELSAWLATEDGLTECARLHIRPDRVLRAAMVLAAHADHSSGRHCAVTNATVAQGAGCSERTVSTVRKVLSTAGLAVLIRQGHGSPDSARGAWRPAVWHLVSRPKPVDKEAGARAVCDLPPSRRDRRVSPERSSSPSARERARRPKSNPPQTAPKRGQRRCAPRPLHVQLLAADLVREAPLSFGHGHIGQICDALMASGLDLAAWTGKSLMQALDADTKARGWNSPKRVERPGAFLLARLQLLPTRPAVVEPGGLAARRAARKASTAQEATGETRQSAAARAARWYADVVTVTTEAQRVRLLQAHKATVGPVVDEVYAIAGAGRRAARLYPELALTDALTQWATDVLGEEPASAAALQVPAFTSLSTDLLMDLAIGNCDCVVCGSHSATRRPQLPLQSMVCDQCWPVIAAELDGASDLEEWMPA